MLCKNQCGKPEYLEDLCEDCHKEARLKAIEERIRREESELTPAEDRKRADLALKELVNNQPLSEPPKKAARPKKKKRSAAKSAQAAAVKTNEKQPRSALKQKRTKPTTVESTPAKATCLVPDCSEAPDRDGLCVCCRSMLILWRNERDRLDKCPILISGSQVETFKRHFPDRAAEMDPGA